MKIDIPTKDMVENMVAEAVRKEMNQIHKILDRIRKRIAKLEGK